MASALRLSQLTITGYKNYAARAFSFQQRIIGICGLNGKGKTNLLDAINYLCFTKSYFTRSEALNIHFDTNGFRIDGMINDENGHAAAVACIYRPGGKKEIMLDGIPYEKFSHHIGKFPCVLIAPDDVALITGGSEERRKFMDVLLCQLNDEYLHQLLTYNKLLADRNGLLKLEAQQQRKEDLLLTTIDDQLAPAGEFLFREREKFCTTLFPLVQSFYQHISGGSETIEMIYESPLTGKDFRTLLKQNRDKDRLLQRTLTGIHKDELSFVMKEHLFRNLASQGQRKSLLFACRLAAFELLRQEKGFTPLLLLDDIFEKLDEKRMHRLLEFICEASDGQVFITDTDATRLEKAIAAFDQSVQIIELE